MLAVATGIHLGLFKQRNHRGCLGCVLLEYSGVHRMNVVASVAENQLEAGAMET